MPSDEPVYRRLADLLRYGVVAGLVPVVAGLVLALGTGRTGAARALITAGVALTLVLPPAQALVAAVAYASRGDRRFALVATGVLFVQLLAAAVAWIR